MADTVNLLGHTVKKNTAMAGAAVGAVVIAVAVYRSRKAKTAAGGTPAAATTTAGDLYPPDGTTGNPGDPNSTDPATGITYGDEQAQGGYGASYGTGGYDAAGYPIGSPQDIAYEQSQGSGGVPIAYPVTPTGTGSGGVPTFSDNASWAQYAEAYMVNQLGGDPNTIGNALGKYITGGKVTQAQADVINQAIAFAGNPPVNGANGMPPSINLVTTPPPPPPPPPPPKKKPKHTVTADGKQDFQAIANSNGVTEAELKSANPHLAALYEGTGKPVPRGTHVVIPVH